MLNKSNFFGFRFSSVSYCFAIKKLNTKHKMSEVLTVTCVDLFTCLFTAISRKVVGKMCTRQSRKVIWDMINNLFLTVPDTVAVEPGRWADKGWEVKRARPSEKV